MTRTTAPKKLAIVGAGPAGLACAVTAAERGHDVTLFEAAKEIGGQFNLAKRIPGKEEFAETLRYFKRRITLTGVKLKLQHRVTAHELIESGFDHIALATGVVPRSPDILGLEHAKVVSYIDVIEGRCQPGQQVAILGAGGIGFDVAELLSHDDSEPNDIGHFQQEWGIDPTFAARGGIKPSAKEAPVRQIWLLQRKDSKVGEGLAKTTGWIRRAILKRRNVKMLAGVSYEKIDDAGLHIVVGGERQVLDVDNVIVCTGQVPRRDLVDELQAAGVALTLIGGADVATELDAKRAIEQGTLFASKL